MSVSHISGHISHETGKRETYEKRRGVIQKRRRENRSEEEREEESVR